MARVFERIRAWACRIGTSPTAPSYLDRLARDPRFFFLLRWVQESTGAVVHAWRGPRVAHLAIWNVLGLSVETYGGEPAFAVAFVEGLPGGRLIVVRHLSSGHIEGRSMTPEAWASSVSVAAPA